MRRILSWSLPALASSMLLMAAEGVTEASHVTFMAGAFTLVVWRAFLAATDALVGLFADKPSWRGRA